MKVYFSQVYIEPRVEFPFSCEFQRYLSNVVSKLVRISERYSRKFGQDYKLIFRISARRQLAENDICGPTVFKKDKDVEYTIFLPHKKIMKGDVPPNEGALRHLFAGVVTVFESLEIDTSKLLARREEIISEILGNPEMLEEDE